ncbi:isopentenyl-diphosphate Delta-isomerase [Nostoc ellipsosporum NOK]|nr:isopentenyl-diphosphate Delta-isomerase [Nostoc ellipsosporum NOK]
MDVILVDEQDVELGTMEKMEAHRQAVLHRAFSIFIFNKKNELLLHQRALSKYHSGGLWTNTCCSHPFPGEKTEEAASRRLQEEMGFQTPLQHAFSFVYKAPFDNGLTEHEYDHVFIGTYEGTVSPDPAEVADYCYKPVDEIVQSMQTHPQRYTEWFKIALPRLVEFLQEKNSGA